MTDLLGLIITLSKYPHCMTGQNFACLKFAKKALRLEQFKSKFPVQKNLRGIEKRNEKSKKKILLKQNV